MAKGKQLSSDLKSRIVAKHQAGNSYGNISEQLHVAKSTVQSVINKYKSLGSTENLPRSGRPRKITTRMARKIVRQVQNDPRVTRNDIKKKIIRGRCPRFHKYSVQRSSRCQSCWPSASKNTVIKEEPPRSPLVRRNLNRIVWP